MKTYLKYTSQLKLILVLFVLITCSSLGFSQNSCITGFAIDENGKSLKYVEIKLFVDSIYSNWFSFEKPFLVLGATTDNKGFFLIKPVAPGKYHLRAKLVTIQS
nr:carboxypeptidase regulatory-like domain-containing protein [Bacteroidota bacterium]